jgi:hypothetical protein
MKRKDKEISNGVSPHGRDAIRFGLLLYPYAQAVRLCRTRLFPEKVSSMVVFSFCVYEFFA